MPGSYDVPWCFGSTRLVSSLKLLSIYLIYSRQLFLDCISLWGYMYIYQNDAANRASQSEKFMTSWWEASTTTQPQHNQPAPAFYSYKYHNIWFNKRETNWPIWRKKNLYFEGEETKVIFIIENDEKERRYRLVSLMVPGHILVVMVIYWLGYPKF